MGGGIRVSDQINSVPCSKAFRYPRLRISSGTLLKTRTVRSYFRCSAISCALKKKKNKSETRFGN